MHGHEKSEQILINIEDIPDTGLDIDMSKPPDFIQIASNDFKLKEDIHIKCSIKKIGEDIYLDGDFDTKISVECSRCVKWFNMDVSSGFNGIYFHDNTNSAQSKKNEVHEIREDEIDTYTYNGEEIDILPHIRDQIILSIPMKPLCKDDCKGLCQICGGNKNKKDCGCVEESGDPRLEVLKELKKRMTVKG